ncbi:phosphatase PAP2 family protein [Aquabacter spiritensis]|uniref:Undecaprenyl-diphosphatase n=1 Tax=Aquabacter spiritensis TaxID=933073 RepID=A0A4R3M6K4_9HYPH|nr:phosphatase PAP2 family protein [Aquabacter spiritensis]TCT08233.1 undecaprenyl-diphosphatase [Aquabacter spiritensis]
MKRILSPLLAGLSRIPVLGPVFSRVGEMERVTLAIIASAALAFYAFLAIADEVTENETRQIDERILLALRAPGDASDPIGPRWMEEAVRDITALGGTTILTLVTLAVLIYLLLIHKRLTALMVFVSVAGGTVLSSALKWGFARPRPDLVPHGMEVYTSSFPSGHSTMSAVVYLTLGALLARSQPRQRVKVFLLVLAACVTVIVGVSRVYLGVHWPTDVLGGWALGAGWACLCWLILLWLQMHGDVEPEGRVGPDT